MSSIMLKLMQLAHLNYQTTSNTDCIDLSAVGIKETRRDFPQLDVCE